MIRHQFNKYKNNKFLKNFLTLFTGSVIAQGIVFLSIPILTRLFDEEVFGIYALYVSTIFLIKTLATFNLELTIILPKRDKDAINLLAVALIFTFIFSTLLSFFLYIFHDRIIMILNIEKISHLIYIIPISVFLLGNISILEYWSNRTNNFKNISIGKVSKSLSMSSTQLITGFSTLHSIGLVPGMIIGQFINTITLIKFTFNDIKKNINYISLNRMRFLIFKYQDIPTFGTLIIFINTLSNELPVLLITRYFGIGNTGIYGLSVKVSQLFPGAIGQSIGQVFFNKASKLYNLKEDIYSLLKKTIRHLFILGVGIFTSLFIISYFLDYTFGEQWTSVGLYVRILIPWLFSGFLNSPVSSLVEIFNKQKPILFYNIILLCFRILALYIGYTFYHSMIASLFLFSLVGMTFNIYMIFYFLKISKTSNIKN